MNDLAPLPHSTFRVTISDADLALYLEGDGEHLLTFRGIVTASDNDHVAEGLPFLLELGPFDGEALGVYASRTTVEMACSFREEAEVVLARLREAHETGCELAATVFPKGEPRPVGDHALHWWAAEVSLDVHRARLRSPSRSSRELSLDADLGIRLLWIDPAGSFLFEGEISASRRATLEEGRPVRCCFAASATNTLEGTEAPAAFLSWAIGDHDAKGMLDLVSLAEAFGAELVLELRLKSYDPVDRSKRWSVDDVRLLAVGLLR